MNSGIYQIRNLVNGSVYIGQSTYLPRRKAQHFHSLNHNAHYCKQLQDDFNKFGKDNFIFDVLEYCSPDELTQREQWFVDITKPRYNACLEDVLTPKGLVRSIETRKKMTQSKYKKRIESAFEFSQRETELFYNG